MPGPGTYTNRHLCVGTEGRNWNIQGKRMHFAEPLVLNIKKNVPGPGKYG